MLTFLRKIVVSLLLLLVLLAVLSAAYRPGVRAALKAALALDVGVNTLALGDSHAECSVDDRAVPWLRNLGVSAESSVISFWKLHHFLDQNPGQVKNVFFFVAPKSITSSFEHRWHAVPRVVEWKFIVQNLGWLLPPEARRTFCLTWQKRLYLWLRCDIGLPLGGYYSRRLSMGGFNDRDSGKAVNPSPAANLAVTPTASVLEVDHSPLLANHVRRLVQAGLDNGASVYLINSPVRVMHLPRSAPDPSDPYYSLMRELSGDPRVSFHDFGNYPLPADCFRDRSHLNPKGAAIFTQHLVELIGGPRPREDLPERTAAGSTHMPGPRKYAVGAAALLCCCVIPLMRRRVPAPSQAPIKELDG
jgi:hypothetical protein